MTECHRSHVAASQQQHDILKQSAFRCRGGFCLSDLSVTGNCSVLGLAIHRATETPGAPVGSVPTASTAGGLDSQRRPLGSIIPTPWLVGGRARPSADRRRISATAAGRRRSLEEPRPTGFVLALATPTRAELATCQRGLVSACLCLMETLWPVGCEGLRCKMI